MEELDKQKRLREFRKQIIKQESITNSIQHIGNPKIGTETKLSQGSLLKDTNYDVDNEKNEDRLVTPNILKSAQDVHEE